MIWLIIIFSFLFEASFTNIVGSNSLFIPLFTLTSLTFVYPYLKKKKTNYIIIYFIVGLFYDIVFSNSIFVNTISFVIIGVLVMLCYNYVKYNIYTSNIINIIMLITYRIFSYIILLSINYIKFNKNIFYKGIYSSILINIVYGIFIYISINLLAKILNKRVD